jgi:hypothetical protein
MPTRTGQLTMPEKFAAQLLALGKTHAFAAEHANIGITTLKKCLTLPLFQDEIERLRMLHFETLSESLGARLSELQHPALEAMGELLEAESEPVRKSSAEYILDHGPIGKKVRQEQQTQGQISLDQAALTAILAGAANIGNTAIIGAFAAVMGQKEPVTKDVTPDSQGMGASSKLPVLSDGPSSPPLHTWHGKATQGCL